ncbi:hypothetical protein B0H11DRAFT_1911901 [Mycena galericulata]|nr:hypothetical protein B0H11DRAFT_1911901 [Mycena galericulata]
MVVLEGRETISLEFARQVRNLRGRYDEDGTPSAGRTSCLPMFDARAKMTMRMAACGWKSWDSAKKRPARRSMRHLSFRTQKNDAITTETLGYRQIWSNRKREVVSIPIVSQLKISEVERENTELGSRQGAGSRAMVISDHSEDKEEAIFEMDDECFENEEKVGKAIFDSTRIAGETGDNSRSDSHMNSADLVPDDAQRHLSVSDGQPNPQSFTLHCEMEDGPSDNEVFENEEENRSPIFLAGDSTRIVSGIPEAPDDAPGSFYGSDGQRNSRTFTLGSLQWEMNGGPSHDEYFENEVNAGLFGENSIRSVDGSCSFRRGSSSQALDVDENSLSNLNSPDLGIPVVPDNAQCPLSVSSLVPCGNAGDFENETKRRCNASLSSGRMQAGI